MEELKETLLVFGVPFISTLINVLIVWLKTKQSSLMKKLEKSLEKEKINLNDFYAFNESTGTLVPVKELNIVTQKQALEKMTKKN